MVERCCDLAARMARRLANRPDIRIINEVVLNQVLLSFGDAEFTADVIARIQADGTAWLGGSSFHGEPAIRISVSGWNTREDDIDRSADAILAASRRAAAHRAGSVSPRSMDRHCVIATGSFGRSRPLRGADTMRSTTSRPFVTDPKSV